MYEKSPEDENTVSSASLCMSPSADDRTLTDVTTDTDMDKTDAAYENVEHRKPLFASTPLTRPITNGHDRNSNKRASSDTVNGNVNVHIVSECTNSMDVLSGGESDAGDTLNRRNNNSISSTLTNALRENPSDLSKRRGSADLTYSIAKELLMTERTYKRDLELVTVTWSSKVSGLSPAGADVVAALARACLALEPLALPAGSLLAKLERSLAQHNSEDSEEPEYKKIADFLYDHLSNTFEAYATYIEQSAPLVAMVESIRRRSPAADKEIAGFDAASPLPLACLLLRPLHRLLHIERLAVGE
ncbi:hypothetical protein O0L34_g8314 [Tuta absoluta]|nr:hypothetical protein O0L34_g8314 [Tuta absoluta]